MTDTVEREVGVVDLEERVRQLETALRSRVLVEQAKGVLLGRHGVGLGSAFDALRGCARATQQRLHDVARQVVEEPETPAEVMRRLRGATDD